MATETTDEEFARQWAADYQPTTTNKNEPALNPTTPEPWRQVGSSDAQIEEYKKKLQFLETELSTSRDTNKTSHEKHQETISRLNRQFQASEAQFKEQIKQLTHELNLVKNGGLGVNDSLSKTNYSKQAPTEKPKAAALSSVIAEEQKQKEKGKEKEKEEKGKEREEKERQDRQREERDQQDKERDEREKQEREKQSATHKQQTAELEAKFKQVTEQVPSPPFPSLPALVLTTFANR